MERATTLLALTTLLLVMACGGDGTGPGNPIDIGGTYTGLWTVDLTILNTGDSGGCFNAGGLEVAEHGDTQFSGTFFLDATEGCIDLDMSGTVARGTIGPEETAGFGLSVTDAVVMMDLPLDFFELLAAELGCDVLSAEDLTGAFDGDRLLASARAGFACSFDSLLVDLELDLRRAAGSP